MRRIYNLIAIATALVLLVACSKEEQKQPQIFFTAISDMNPTFSADGGKKSYSFTSLYDWSIESFDDWVSVSPASGTTLDNKFVISVESHDGGWERTSHILVHLANGDAVKIPITQLMRERYDVEPTEAYVADAEATTLEIEISTNIEYIVQVPNSAKWVKFIETRSMRDETLHFELEANTSNKSRVAFVKALDARDDKSELHTFAIVQSADGEAVNEIVYTSDSGKRIEPTTTDGFGAPFSIHLFDGLEGRIIFGDEVTNIPAQAFADKSDLQYIKLPETLKRIEDEAFSGCIALESITLPAYTSHLGVRAFANCETIKSFTLPRSVTAIGASLFEGCSGELIVECPIDSQSNTLNAEHWLYGSAFESAIVNQNVGVNAFINYTSLKNVHFGEECNGVGQNAFAGCSVERVTAESLAAWCSTAFANSTANPIHTGEAELIIDGKVVTELNTPESIVKVDNYTFYNYKRLQSVRINDNIRGIGTGAFGACNLEYIVLGTGIKAVGSNAFNECSCETLTINFNTPKFESNTTKTNHWFHGLDVDTVIFGEDVTSIETYAISGLALETLVVGNNVTFVGNGAFAECSLLTDVTLGTSITTLDKHAFYACGALEYITLPEGVTTLGKYLFQECDSLQEITIPAGVTTIGDYCFYGCTELESIYCKPTTPPTLSDNYVFPQTTTIYVPADSLALYKSAEYWAKYKDAFVGYSF